MEEFADLTNEALATRLASATQEFDALLEKDKPTPEEFARAKELREEIAGINAEVTARSEREAELAEMRSEREAAKTAAASSEGDEGDDDDDDDEEDEEDDEDDEEEEALEASAKTVSRRRRSTDPVVPPKEEKGALRIVASADVPHFAPGTELKSWDDIASAVKARAEMFSGGPAGIEGGAVQKFTVATMSRGIPAELTIGAKHDSGQAQEIMDLAANQSNLPGGSLVAAGGWCAPSQILYDFCDFETTDGLLDLPEVRIDRGGIQYAPQPDFQGLYDAIGVITEAEAIAGVTKECYELECPEMDEIRLDALYMCVRFPLLTAAGWPELIANIENRLTKAYQHRVSVKRITDILADLGAAVATGGVGGVTADVLSRLEFHAQVIRQKHRLAKTAMIEGFAPHWLPAALRADLANRNGVDFINVTDADVVRWLAQRNIRLQFVYNWQDLDDSVPEPFYPDTVQVALYPAGAYVAGMKDVINLGVVHDSASLMENTYLGSFMEEGHLVYSRCLTGALLEIPTACFAGLTGAAELTCTPATP